MIRLLFVTLFVTFVSSEPLFFRSQTPQSELEKEEQLQVCPDYKTTCQRLGTCCMNATKQFSCCPLPKAVCCSDGLHCCPEGFRCDASDSKCHKDETGHFLPQLPLTMATKSYDQGEESKPATSFFTSQQTKPSSNVKAKPNVHKNPAVQRPTIAIVPNLKETASKQKTAAQSRKPDKVEKDKKPVKQASFKTISQKPADSKKQATGGKKIAKNPGKKPVATKDLPKQKVKAASQTKKPAVQAKVAKAKVVPKVVPPTKKAGKKVEVQSTGKKKEEKATVPKVDKKKIQTTAKQPTPKMMKAAKVVSKTPKMKQGAVKDVKVESRKIVVKKPADVKPKTVPIHKTSQTGTKAKQVVKSAKDKTPVKPTIVKEKVAKAVKKDTAARKQFAAAKEKQKVLVKAPFKAKTVPKPVSKDKSGTGKKVASETPRMVLKPKQVQAKAKQVQPKVKQVQAKVKQVQAKVKQALPKKKPVPVSAKEVPAKVKPKVLKVAKAVLDPDKIKLTKTKPKQVPDKVKQADAQTKKKFKKAVPSKTIAKVEKKLVGSKIESPTTTVKPETVKEKLSGVFGDLLAKIPVIGSSFQAKQDEEDDEEEEEGETAGKQDKKAMAKGPGKAKATKPQQDKKSKVVKVAKTKPDQPAKVKAPKVTKVTPVKKVAVVKKDDKLMKTAKKPVAKPGKESKIVKKDSKAQKPSTPSKIKKPSGIKTAGSKIKSNAKVVASKAKNVKTISPKGHQLKPTKVGNLSKEKSRASPGRSHGRGNMAVETEQQVLRTVVYHAKSPTPGGHKVVSRGIEHVVHMSRKNVAVVPSQNVFIVLQPNGHPKGKQKTVTDKLSAFTDKVKTVLKDSILENESEDYEFLHPTTKPSRRRGLTSTNADQLSKGEDKNAKNGLSKSDRIKSKLKAKLAEKTKAGDKAKTKKVKPAIKSSVPKLSTPVAGHTLKGTRADETVVKHAIRTPPAAGNPGREKGEAKVPPLIVKAPPLRPPLKVITQTAKQNVISKDSLKSEGKVTKLKLQPKQVKLKAPKQTVTPPPPALNLLKKIARPK